VFGNVSPFVVTPPAGVSRSEATQPAPTPPPDQHPAALSPDLRIATVRRAGRRIIVGGTVARRADGRITATWTNRGRRLARGRTHARLGKFKLALKIPRSATRLRRGSLDVSYLGGPGFHAQTRRVAIRSG
jgi:hypothetical protein